MGDRDRARGPGLAGAAPVPPLPSGRGQDGPPAGRADDPRRALLPAPGGGKLRELRFVLDGDAVRMPYWLAPQQRIVLLTVFRKTRMREAAEIERAFQAQKICEAEHGHARHRYERHRES
ncbi:predicted protein [Streptomyces sp. SPB78]|nr:predicted protein [Streptomyces sp. SPB78]